MACQLEFPLQESFHPATCGEVGDVFLAASLRQQVAQLPEWQRAVIILRYQEDLDPLEIAELLKIPINTVKSRLHRAISTLRTVLERKQRVRA